MATPVNTALQRGELERALVRRLGLMVPGTQGTADSGTTSTLVDATLVDAGDARIKDQWLGFFKGTGAGQYRRNSAFTAGSDQITFTPVGTAPDTTTEYGVIDNRIGDPLDLARWIQEAHQRLTIDKKLRMGICKETGPVDEIVIGNALNNGAMFRFTAGASAAPDGWTLAGTGAAVARESTITAVGLYSAKLTSDGTNAAYLYQQVTPLSRWRGRTIRAYGLVLGDVANRATIRIGQGVAGSLTTIGSAVTAATANVWKWADISNAFNAAVSSADPTSLTLQFGISAGSAVNAYCGFGFIEDPEPRNEFDLDADENVTAIRPILKASELISESTSGAMAFREENDILSRDWHVTFGSTRRIVVPSLHRRFSGPRILRYEGWKAHSALSAATTTWPSNDVYLLDVAEAIARKNLGGEFLDRGSRDPIMRGDVDEVIEKVLPRSGISIDRNAKIVEPN